MMEEDLKDFLIARAMAQDKIDLMKCEVVSRKCTKVTSMSSNLAEHNHDRWKRPGIVKET